MNLTNPVLIDIVNERGRQAMKGFDAQHDDNHPEGELARAAACYAWPHVVSHTDSFGRPLDANGRPRPMTDAELKHSWSYVPALRWPWSGASWKLKDTRSNLVRAAALIVAEIERIDRKERSKS